MKTNEIIRKYILAVVNAGSFTWIGDVAQYTIYGFKGARFKNYENAIARVESVVAELLIAGEITMIEGEPGYQPTIHSA